MKNKDADEKCYRLAKPDEDTKTVGPKERRILKRLFVFFFLIKLFVLYKKTSKSHDTREWKLKDLTVLSQAREKVC